MTNILNLTDVKLVRQISSSHIAVVYCRNDKYGVVLMRNNLREVAANIEPLFDSPITCVTASSEYILIAKSAPQPKLLIYKGIGPLDAPHKSIDLVQTPTELVIYGDSLCICAQASPDGTDVMFISLKEGQNGYP